MSCYWSNNNRAEYIERCTFGSRRGLCKPVVEKLTRRHFPTPHLITQDISQLHKIYGRDDVISGNCHVQIAYATSNLETAKHLSEASGITTIVKEAESVSGDRGSIMKRNVSVSLQELSRPLLTVDECMRLRGAEKDAEGRILVPGDMLIFVAGHPAVYGRQMLFFLDPELSRRAKLPAPEHSERTVKKRDDAGKARAPILGDTGEPDEPSEAEMIEILTSGNVKAEGTRIRDSQGREYSLERTEGMAR
jgi:type IV secretory pathway TraG/TraD family ATPase VirD4